MNALVSKSDLFPITFHIINFSTATNIKTINEFKKNSLYAIRLRLNYICHRMKDHIDLFP